MKIYTQKFTTPAAGDRLRFDASFSPFIRFLRSKMYKTTDIRAKFYKYIISKFERHPELLQPITNMDVIENNDEIVQLIRMSLLPLSANSDDYMMALAFIKPAGFFYYTAPFKTLLIDENVAFNSSDDERGNLKCMVKLILERCYNMKPEIDERIVKRVHNVQEHYIRYHNIVHDNRFIEVESIGDLPELNQEWLSILNANDHDFIEVIERFPLEKFRFEGFSIIHSENVSKDVAINDLKSAILNMHIVPLGQTLDKVEVAIGELLNDPRIRIGITPFFKVNGEVVYDRSFITKCVIVSLTQQPVNHTISIDEIYKKLSGNPKPYIISEVNREVISSKPFLSGLTDSGIKSFMVYPILTRDGLLGVFELGSPVKGAVSEKSLEQLREAFPIITDLVYYMIKSFDSKINELVKEKFTSLQESVEWKFNEVAWQYMLKDPDEKSEIDNITFNDVYPLYGAVDIRNSSIERNTAIRKDYSYQLSATKALLEKVSGSMSLMLLEDLQYKCEQYMAFTGQILTPEDELHINEFIDKDISALLKHLSGRHPEFIESVNEYLQNSNELTGMFYNNRRAYESTLKAINQKVVAYIEEEVKKLQKLYPFYFEKYRSDGVEYNIYIGQSIARVQLFDHLYVKNMRVWQLNSMAAIARMVHQMAPQMPLPLQVTLLILVHSNTIQISFRKDEHQFDVEGSYNIRYEIIKKRIDKVGIKNTGERLTQPGHIAIVYTNPRDIEEYAPHIHFLQTKGVLTDVFELHDLEELQGVSGLKAIRVGVKLNLQE